MWAEMPKLNAQRLLNNLFRHPYTLIDYIVQDLGMSRQAAAKYLSELTVRGFIEKVQAGRIANLHCILNG